MFPGKTACNNQTAVAFSNNSMVEEFKVPLFYLNSKEDFLSEVTYSRLQQAGKVQILWEGQKICNNIHTVF